MVAVSIIGCIDPENSADVPSPKVTDSKLSLSHKTVPTGFKPLLAESTTAIFTNTATGSRSILEPHQDIHFNNLNEADKKLLQQATAAGLIEIYYQAIINRNYNLALACRKLSVGLEDEFKSFWDGYISIQNLRIHIPENYTEEEIELPQTPNQLILRVEYDVIRDERKQYTETTGQSVYLITLYRTSPEERWQISGLGEA